MSMRLALLGFLVFFAGCGGDAESPKSAPELRKSESNSERPGAATPKTETAAGEKSQGPRSLRIAAASDLRFALPDIVAAFERLHPEATVTVTYGSSGNFFAQLSNEAPFDLFLSADSAYPWQLVEQGRAKPGADFGYATGHIVLWTPKGSPLDIEKKGIEILGDPSVQKIAIANPRTAPYGRAAVAALHSLGVYEAVESRLVYGENVALTAQMVESGAADVGIIALSLVVAPAMQGKGRHWLIPETSHPPIEQAGVILSWAQDAALADAFRDYLLSGAGADVLRQFGFVPKGE